jgi:hypothetical protein
MIPENLKFIFGLIVAWICTILLLGSTTVGLIYIIEKMEWM